MERDYLELLSPRAFIALLERFPPLETRTVPADDALGRFLAEDLPSPENLPALPRSSMDGYAVMARDCYGATETNPTYLELAADLDILAVRDQPLESGQCAGVVTGGSLPPGADAVVMVEHTQNVGAATIEIRKSVAPGENMVLAGEDTRRGELLLPAGTLLRAAELGLLAALGVRQVRVGGLPRAAVISTGDELVAVSATPRPGQIRDANAPALAAIIRQAGAAPSYLGIVADRVEALTRAMAAALDQADCVFLSGGSSVGVRDLTIEALSLLPDTEVLAHGLAISPGKPTILARCRGKAVWGLPGQVASAQVVMQVFGAPFLAHLAGDRCAFTRPRPEVTAVLARNLASRQGRHDYVRVRLDAQESGPPLAVPVLGKSGLLKTLIQAHGLLPIPADREGLEAGTTVRVNLL